jgi:hypothetical protein
MAPSKDELNKIAVDAERDLNSYQAKQGLNNVSVEDAGVDSIVEKKFPGAEVKVGTEISTNAGYNRRIPPEEGGELDDRGRQVLASNPTQYPGIIIINSWAGKPPARILRVSEVQRTSSQRPKRSAVATTTTMLFQRRPSES